MAHDRREAHDRIYDINRSVLDASGPMVVSVDGVVASIAVTEFMAMTAGLRPIVRHLNYRGGLDVVIKTFH
jgi:hypothetical protein